MLHCSTVRYYVFADDIGLMNIVDGGHRAIKYTRLHGVKPDIYPEGTHFAVSLVYTLFFVVCMHSRRSLG